ncbi:MAG: tRNA preQ1(34) S-adenosylmethionine ribosyltransferase-isomerase QueA [Planctomycetaceae bacterium]|jgi:S-adenosylmethionine:tRNA ribosyltransferase-isomerase|nr:tRNA preQ1(34) S-adenosylmethionine ribosyltransferase-isomerase QueA [Planctomycetaceae bacterium]
MLSHYDYELPPDLIAQNPLRNRSDARLLVVDRKTGKFQHLHVCDLPSLLEPNDCVVVNDTKVLPARLVGTRKKTGGNWEGLFLGFDSNQLWKIIGKTRGKIQSGESVQLQTPEGHLGFSLEFGTKLNDNSWIVKPQTKDAPLTALEQVGWVPIPPYIRNGRMIPEDKEFYQTVYALKPGAVAAPTAGLHFTPQLIDIIKQQGITVTPVTLHVGMGTFKPITVENIHEHPMHAEWCSLTEPTSTALQHCKVTGGRIIAVGTTSVRVLESAADLKPFEGETSLFIRPPYQFKNVDVLLTNFHLPKSTLLILVRTFGGDELIQEAYREAVQKKYRFFSYGDAMLIC